MKIGVVGAGAIGCYVGGAVAAARAAEVVLVGRSRVGDELAAYGLSIKELAGASRTANVAFSTEPAALATCDTVLCGVPVRIVPFVLRLPTPVARVALRSQLKVDPEARSSMWEDLTRGRPTEVDYLNGEIVRLATQHGLDAPRNRRLVELVHAAETNGSPAMTAAALADALLGV